MDQANPPRPETLSALLEQVDELQPLPASVLRVIELAGDRRSTLDQLSFAIDPALASRLLRIANSAHYGHRGEIGSIREAVLLLGFGAVRTAAVASAVITGAGGLGSFDSRRFWTHCVTVAEVARLISTTHRRHQEHAFTAGVLHGLGRMAFAQLDSDRLIEARTLAEEDRIDLEAAELKLFGVGEAELGGALAARWEFPEPLVDSIALHAIEPRQQEDPIGLAADVERACAFTAACGLSDGIEPARPPSRRELDPEWFTVPLARALRDAGGMPALRDRAQSFVATALGEDRLAA